MNCPDYPELVFNGDFDQRTADELEWKGWFDAASVRLPNGVEIPLAFRDPVTLAQDLADELASGNACMAELVLIIVPRVTESHMRAAVNQLYEQGFFNRLLSIGQGGLKER